MKVSKYKSNLLYTSYYDKYKHYFVKTYVVCNCATTQTTYQIINSLLNKKVTFDFVKVCNWHLIWTLPEAFHWFTFIEVTEIK